MAIGTLIAAGHDLDDLLDRYSFGQIAALYRSILVSRADFANLILGPLLGKGYKGARVEGANERHGSPQSGKGAGRSGQANAGAAGAAEQPGAAPVDERAAARDRAIIQALGRVGMSVSTVSSSAVASGGAAATGKGGKRGGKG